MIDNTFCGLKETHNFLNHFYLEDFMQAQTSDFKHVFIDYINQKTVTAADQYIRANEMIDILENYFLFNIDDVDYDGIREMSLNQLSEILQRKIDKYKKYRRTEEGNFVEEEPLTKWLREGAAHRGLKPLVK